MRIELMVIRLTATLGLAAAQVQLGLRYGAGEGVPQDDAESARWLRRAAEQGDCAAQTLLGPIYLDGRGVPQDGPEAVRWLRRAAAQGAASDGRTAWGWVSRARLVRERTGLSAQLMLGHVYEAGYPGVEQDDAEAVRWYRLAAEHGLGEAQFNLGFMYQDGRGVPQDDVQAYMWTSLAASHSYGKIVETAVQYIDVLAGALTPEALNEAQCLAREWEEMWARTPR
jgi:TPR repeat protein